MNEEIPEPVLFEYKMCPICDRKLRNQIDYENHYKKVHIEPIRLSKYIGRWFLEDFSSKNVIYITNVSEDGEIYGNVWKDYGLLHHGIKINTYSLHKEIVKEEAKKIVKEWYEKSITNLENRYKKDYKDMFGEKEE